MKDEFSQPPSRATSRSSRLLRSFGYAFQGLAHMLRTQPNARIHVIISTGVILLAWWLRLSRSDWAVLLLAIMIVWIAELFNTAVEAVVDMTMPRPHPLAKTAKDVAAAAVFVGAIGAVLIGLLLLGPPLVQTLAG